MTDVDGDDGHFGHRHSKVSPTSKNCHQHHCHLEIHFEIFSVDFLAENCHLIRGHKKSLTDFESFKRLLEDELFVDHLNKELDSKTFQKLSKNSPKTHMNFTKSGSNKNGYLEQGPRTRANKNCSE